MMVHRRLTARWRRLPDYLIIGAQKCGTSSLYAYLSNHPQILPAFKKEVGFFNRTYHHGPRYYQSYFPHRDLRLETDRPRTITGEATPDYLFHGGVAGRVADLVPGVHLIVLLRDPVRRAFSHYQHNVRFGFEDRSFERAVEEEMRRLEADGAMIDDDETYQDPFRRRFSYVARGRYLQQLDRWLLSFPVEQMLVLRSEDLFSEPTFIYHRVLEFLGVEPTHLPSFAVHNEGAPGRRMGQSIQQSLQEYFAPFNDALSLRLGTELAW
jgi:hypothetical protein